MYRTPKTLQRQIDEAHYELDRLGVPQDESTFGLTVKGRISQAKAKPARAAG